MVSLFWQVYVQIPGQTKQFLGPRNRPVVVVVLYDYNNS
jgi:hypothetical protein